MYRFDLSIFYSGLQQYNIIMELYLRGVGNKKCNISM